MKIAELFAELGFKTNASEVAKVKDMLSVMGEMNLAGVLAATGLGAAAAGVAELAQATASYAIGLSTFSMRTGLSTQYVQQWEMAVERAGGSAEDARASLIGLQTLMRDIRMGTAQSPMAVAITGIEPGKDSLPVMLQKIASALQQNVSPEVKNLIAQQLHFDAASQRVLQTSKDLNAELALGAGMSTDEVERMTESFRQMTQVFQDLKVAGRELVSDLAPLIRMILEILDYAVLGVRGTFAFAGKILDFYGNLAHGKFDASGVGNFYKGILGAPARAGASNHNSVTIHVNGAQSPVDTARRVREEIRRWLNDTAYQGAAPTT